MTRGEPANGRLDRVWGARTWAGGAGLIFGASALRLLLGIGLFFVARLKAPEAPYEWLSRLLKGPDAIAYQKQALVILNFWQGGAENLSTLFSSEYLGYPALLAAAYWLTTPHPLVGVVINALCFLVVGLLAHRLALLLGNTPARANGLALLVALWPPSLTYSSILLKDSLVLLGVFAFLVFAVQAVVAARRQAALSARFTGPVLGMAAGSLILMNLRQDFQPVCLVVGLVAVVLGLLGSVRRGRRGGLLASLAVGLALLGAVYLNANYSVAQLLMRSAPNLDGRQSSRISAPAPPLGTAASPHNQMASTVSMPADLLGLGGVSWLRSPYEVFSQAKLRLIKLRWEYAVTGGVSLSPDAQVIPYGSVPRRAIFNNGLYTLFLFPYPWERWPQGGSLSWLSFSVGLQAVFWYLLLPGLALGLIMGAARNFLAFGVICTWLVLVGAVLSFVDLNLGTLYRHRDMVVLPLLPFLYSGLYAWLWSRGRTTGGAGAPE